MAACRLSAHDQAGSEEELDPQRLAVARRFPGTANGDRHITLTASTRTGEHSVRDAPGHWLSQHQCKGHAQNVQIRDSSRLDQPRTGERASRRGESHPPPLSGPDVTVSRHPAPTVRLAVNAISRQWANRSGLYW